MDDLEAIERELAPARMCEDNEEHIQLIPRALALSELSRRLSRFP